jgi:4-aminobutyrate aminotransferase
MAKGIANGFPLANTITTGEIARSMAGSGLTISTFGGNPVSTAASLATLEVMEEEAPPSRVAEIGAQLQAGLHGLWEKYPLIGDVRGKGLMQGVELVADRETKEPAPQAVNQLFEATKARGLLIGKGGMYNNVLRISPALIATPEDVEMALAILDHAFGEVQEGF